MSHNVGAILLAAGKSRRMGSCKQLLPLGSSTVIGRCLATLQHGGVEHIVVVVSEEGHDVADAAKANCVQVAVNREPESDMASSVRTGRDILSTGFSGMIVALCDYPLVEPATILSLIQCHALFPADIIIPSHQGKRGHPLLFPRIVLDELHVGMTLRDVVRLHSNNAHEIEVDDPGVLIDMDFPEDYLRVCNVLNQI